MFTFTFIIDIILLLSTLCNSIDCKLYFIDDLKIPSRKKIN